MNLATSRRSWVPCLLWLSICAGCATQSKDHARASTVPPSGQPAAAPSPAAPTSPIREAESANSDMAESEMADEAPMDSNHASRPAPSAGAKERATSHGSAAGSSRGAASPAAAAPTMALPAKAKREVGGGSLDVAPKKPGAAPEFAESPELHAAVTDFEAQWERLGTIRACDEACRAFESMKRAAQRICDLVIANDPRARCLSARARLDQASRDLAARCADCR